MACGHLEPDITQQLVRILPCSLRTSTKSHLDEFSPSSCDICYGSFLFSFVSLSLCVLCLCVYTYSILLYIFYTHECGLQRPRVDAFLSYSPSYFFLLSSLTKSGAQQKQPDWLSVSFMTTVFNSPVLGLDTLPHLAFHVVLGTWIHACTKSTLLTEPPSLPIAFHVFLRRGRCAVILLPLPPES